MKGFETRQDHRSYPGETRKETKDPAAGGEPALCSIKLGRGDFCQAKL